MRVCNRINHIKLEYYYNKYLIDQTIYHIDAAYPNFSEDLIDILSGPYQPQDFTKYAHWQQGKLISLLRRK